MCNYNLPIQVDSYICASCASSDVREIIHRELNGDKQERREADLCQECEYDETFYVSSLEDIIQTPHLLISFIRAVYNLITDLPLSNRITELDYNLYRIDLGDGTYCFVDITDATNIEQLQPWFAQIHALCLNQINDVRRYVLERDVIA